MFETNGPGMEPRLTKFTERSPHAIECLSINFGLTNAETTIEAPLEHFRTLLRDPEFRRERLREQVLAGLREFDAGRNVETRNEEELNRTLDEARDRARNRSPHGCRR
jgi:hypothetical protein